MTYDDLQHLIDDTKVVVIGTDFSDTRRIEQVIEGQFDDVAIEKLDLNKAEDKSTLEHLQKNTGWMNLPMVFINGEMIGGEWELTTQQQLGVNTCGRSTHGFANVIGYCGLIPFVGLSIWYAMTSDPTQAGFVLSAFMAYAAIILSFVGAIHWGRSLHEPHMVRSNLLQIITIIPTLLGWVALLVPHEIGLIILIFGFSLIYLFDRLQYRELYWMQKLRFNLSIGVVFSLLICLLAVQKF
jgi:glutaredoxin